MADTPLARDARIHAIRDRLDAATPGPWEYHTWACGDAAIMSADGATHILSLDPRTPRADGAFIAAAPGDLHWLLAECDHWRARALAAEARP